MDQDTSQATTSTTCTTTGSYVTSSTEGTISGEDQPATVTNAYAINYAQQQQQQQQLALANFQLRYHQNIQDVINKYSGTVGATANLWPLVSPVNVQGFSGLRHEQVFQMPNYQLKSNPIAEGDVSSTRIHQQIPTVGPIQTPHVHNVDQISSEYIS